MEMQLSHLQTRPWVHPRCPKRSIGVVRAHADKRKPWHPLEDIPEPQPKRPPTPRSLDSKRNQRLTRPTLRPRGGGGSSRAGQHPGSQAAAAAGAADATDASSQQPLDWRSYRAKLVSMERAGLLAPGRSSAQPYAFSRDCWAHPLPGPEAGCLLVAAQEGMGFFERTVVLLAAHDADNGSVGFVLNKPSPMKLQEVNLPGTVKDVGDVFGEQQLHVGGPLHVDTLTAIHPYEGLRGAQRVAQGLCFGGVTSAVGLVASGLARARDFKLLLGMAGWGPGQLQGEVEAGAWLVLAASPAVVLAPIPGDPRVARDAGDNMWQRVQELAGSS